MNFHLAGINNQNFIMQDEETGSWWQQVTGEAIHGPLKGQRLKSVVHDEISFAIWKRENPLGRVLRPDEKIAAANRYAPANWEEQMVKVPVVTPKTDSPLEPRDLVVGVKINGASKAYPMSALQKQSPVIDSLGSTPIVIVVGEDKKSVRVFERTVDGQKLEFFQKQNASPLMLVDAETGTEWDFSGKATSGALKDKQLKKVAMLNDYWFDWKLYNPDTKIYQLGEQ